MTRKLNLPSRKIPSEDESLPPKNFAEKSLVSCIANRFEVSTSELIRYTGMPGSTLAGILNRLLTRGVIAPCGTQILKRGRPSIRYRLRLPRPICACQLESTGISAAVVDRDLRLRRLEKAEFSRISTSGEGAEAVISVIRKLKASLPRPADMPSDLALALNAIRMRPHQDRLISSVLPWAGLSLAQELAKRLNIRVKIVSPIAALIAERTGLRGHQYKSVVRFHVGDGISAHMLFNDETYQGHSSLAGQLGHLTVEPNGCLCGCGRRGCLEAYCGGPSLHQRLIEETGCGINTAISTANLRRNSPQHSIDLLWQAWKSEDTYAREFMRPVLDRLAWALGVLVNLIDPELVLASGYVLANRPEWIEQICWRAQQWILFSPARHIQMVSAKASLEDELRVTGTLYFYAFENK